MNNEIDFLYASDKTGEAVRAVVTGTRTIASTTLEVDSLNNWPAKFVATVGTLNVTTGIIDPATVTIFKGHTSGGDIIIDEFAPDYADSGNSIGQVVVIKPNTFWADTWADIMSVAHNQDGTLKDDAVTTDVIADTATTAAKLGTPVAFRVRLSADQTVVTDTAKTIEFDTEDFDLGGNFDTTTHRFVAPYDGVYLFGIIGRMINLASSDTQYLYILKNGTVETASQITIATTNLENKVPITLPVNMAAGDYVSFSVYHDFGSNRDLDGGAGTAGCYAWGHLVGRTD